MATVRKASFMAVQMCCLSASTATRLPNTRFNYALGTQLKRLDLPTVFILEGGYAAKELGVNAANVLDGFEQD